MARQATGRIIEHRGKDGRIYRALRFTAYGQRRFVTLGTAKLAEAEAELRHVLADVERGKWQPPRVEPPPEAKPLPSFHQYAEQWWLRVEKQLAPKTREDYRWRLEKHLLDYFGRMRLDAITIAVVEDYIAAKLAEGERIRAAQADGKPLTEKVTDRRGRTFERPLQPLSARSINMTVTLLGAILESAVERELIGRNPARGRGRRVRERAPARSNLEAASQIAALLDAAGELDSGAQEQDRHVERRAMLATLIFAGLRIGELCALRWRDSDLAAGWLTVGESKTDAGRRRVKVRGALRDELIALRGRRSDAPQDAYVFPTATGGRMSDDNFRARVLGRPAVVVDGEQVKAGTGAVGRANTKLEAAGLPPLPKLTPHSLRRTFASTLYALGETPPVVMQEMGHTSPALALRVYAQAMRRGEDERAALRALVEGGALDADAASVAGSEVVA
jgi:integrase